MNDVEQRRGWSKERWDQWYAQLRKTTTAKSSQDTWEQPPTLNDAVDVTAGSRIVAHQLAQEMHRNHPSLSFQECVSRVFALHPALYESEVATSEHVTKAIYGGRSLT